MATAARIPHLSVEEYLHTSFRPDVDYVDGHIEERNLGQFDHALTQGFLFNLFFVRRVAWQIRVVPEQRVQTGALRFRVPDVCVISARRSKEQIIRSAPILCIEVLSPEDTFRAMRTRVEDFLTMGVPNVWIVDTGKRTLTVCAVSGDVEHRAGVVSVPGTAMSVDLAEVFGILDEA